MHSYDPDRQAYPSPIPAMRPGREVSPVPSLTPIYDALYSEYRRSFRALPGDRSGEEDLGFHGFGTGLASSRGSVIPAAHPGAFWQPYPRTHGGHPPALPPGPRRSHS